MTDISGRRNQDQYMLRLPDGMRDRLHAEAKSNARSLNSEIVARLDASFSGNRQLSSAVAEFLEQHIQSEVNARLKAIAAKIGGAS
ncbi:Arc family DNA-binding protein [Sinorhizobium meliloti]|nr:Arc family DNA-binding protein [Sinorhizobium meliloti]